MNPMCPNGRKAHLNGKGDTWTGRHFNGKSLWVSPLLGWFPSI